MKIIDSIKRLKWYEALIWISSVILILISFLISGAGSNLTMIASLIGVTALIFVAKGDVLGQILTVFFSVFYGIVSWKFHYWGEMITYLGMTAPIAAGAVITWMKNPFQKGEVRVKPTTPGLWLKLLALSMVVTFAFFILLKSFKTPNLLFSTLSVTTSFLAASLTLFRSAYYGLLYAANDVVLIILWILATLEEPSYLSMVICFICFLVNDLYGFVNWRRIRSRQNTQSPEESSTVSSSSTKKS